MILTLVLTALLIGSVVYLALAVVAARRYLTTKPIISSVSEAISILKPLSGLDLNLENNLCTFFKQDYPAFEILFAVREADDPAAAVVKKLQSEYPAIPSRLIITGEPHYPNAKVFSLDHMLAASAHDLVVMSDSDIAVTPKMLRTIAAEFQDPKVGVATCPYRAIPGPGLWSKLEAIGLNTDFLAGILVARMLEGMHFAIGPTIAMRRGALASIGGFDRLKDYLAEDFVLGKFAAAAGHEVILSSYVIDHHIGGSDFRHNVAHRVRWTRSTRRSRPSGYIGQIFMMPTPLVLLVVASQPAWWPLIPAILAIRFFAAWMIAHQVLKIRINWLLLPAEDIAGFLFWIAGFFGKTITWRGRRYRLEPDGRFSLLVS